MSYLILNGGEMISAFITTGLSLKDSFTVLQEISTKTYAGISPP